MPEVMSNLATAATQLDPHVVMQVMQTADDPDAARRRSSAGMAAAFDDVKVAQLLATALALDGQASDRLATIFNTIAPDEDRKRRVLTLTRSLLSETDFGKSGQFQVLWASMEELLVSYNDKPFVSETYRAALDGVGGRAERMAAADLPPELPEWLDSLGQDNVRAPVGHAADRPAHARARRGARRRKLRRDMAALAEDLLMSGAYDDALTVTAGAARARADAEGASAATPAAQALDQLGESLAMRETAALIGDIDEDGWTAIRSRHRRSIGVVQRRSAQAGRRRSKTTTLASDARRSDHRRLRRDGGRRASRSLVGDSRWFVQRRGARLLGRIGTAEAVPLLQPLLRQSDPRVAREAVAALGAHRRSGRGARHPHRAARGHRRRCGARSSRRWSPSAIRASCRCSSASSRRASRSARITTSCSRRSTALGTVGSDEAVPTPGRPWRSASGSSAARSCAR